MFESNWLLYIVLELLWFIPKVKWATQWSSKFVVVHGDYYSQYFGNDETDKFEIWAANSVSTKAFDLYSNGDFAVAYIASVR